MSGLQKAGRWNWRKSTWPQCTLREVWTKLKIFWNFISLHSTYGKLINIFFHSLFHLWKISNSIIISCPIFFVMPISRKKNSIKNCFHISTYFRFKINGEESVANCGYNKSDKTKPYGWNSQDVQNRNGFQCRFLLFRFFMCFVFLFAALHIIIFCENDIFINNITYLYFNSYISIFT